MKSNYSTLPNQLSIVIPIYNEAKRFPLNFKLCQQFYSQQPNWEFIFVNDGSLDQTKNLVEQSIKKYSRMKLVSYSLNQGKGYALKQGVKVAQKPLILITDIDFSTPLTELKLFYPFIQQGSDIVIGTRKVRGANIICHQRPLREWLGKRFTNLTNLWLGLNFSDYTCGFKLFKKPVAQKLFSQLTINRWSYDAEILFLANFYKYHIIEVPVKWANDEHTKVNLFRDIFSSLFDLWRIRYSHWQRK